MRLKALHDLLDVEEVDVERVRALLQEQLAQWLATQDYPAGVIHPLTFLYFPLHRTDTQTLRLHIWPSGRTYEDPTTSEYHKHAWSLTSYVISGSVQNELPTVTPIDAQDADYRLYDIEGRGERTTSRPPTHWSASRTTSSTSMPSTPCTGYP